MRTKLRAVHPVLAASDMRRSLAFYAGIGFETRVVDADSAPRYALATRDGVELHLQWARESDLAVSGDRPVFRFLVEDVDALYQEFLDSGALADAAHSNSPWRVPADTPWGTREFHLRDPQGNGLQFYVDRDPP